LPAVEEQGQPRGALSGRVAVVVGGASGIGRTVAKALARQGARIVIADFDAARMERTVDEILHLGTADAALALPTDVRNDASARSLAADSVKAMGQVDILINMAGVLLNGPLDRIKPGDWKWMLDTNLLGPVRTTLAFLPHLTERGAGHIINTVSAGALTPRDPLTIAYDTGQVALASFTKSLAAAVSETGVQVSLYCIGSEGPRIGQNTRSRGLGRLLHPADDLEEGSGPSDQPVDSLVEALHSPRFLILGDPSVSVPSMELMTAAQ
jgi:NAD(P)-dependent dehydrogenase (short-subunit alcohol dehydrogenase family)